MASDDPADIPVDWPHLQYRLSLEQDLATCEEACGLKG